MPLPMPLRDARFDAVGVGYNSVDHLCVLPNYPDFGMKMAMLDYSIQGGGQTATACAALAKFGFSASYIGKFGAGASGKLAEDSLIDWSVDTSASLHTEACPNQIAIIWIDKGSGERTITYIRGDELSIEPAELSRETVCAGKVLMLDAHNIPAMIQAATWAREANIPTVLDAERIYPDIEHLLDLVDYVITDQFFPRRFTGHEDLRKGLEAMEIHGPFITATRGNQGSVSLVEGEWIEVGALPIQCIDSTGAGDLFHAGFAAGLLMEFDVRDCLKFANIVAGLKCRKLGGRDGIPTRDVALSYMDKF